MAISPVIRPADHTALLREFWSNQAQDVFASPLVMSPRMEDRSDEVTGEPGQTLHIPVMSLISDNPVGNFGEVTVNLPPGATVALVVDQYRESTVGFRNDYELQSALAKGVWAKMQGQALRERREDFNLALETNVTQASQILDVAGNIIDDDLLQMWQQAGINKWPSANRHFVTSYPQAANILGIQRHSDLKFLGDGFAPVIEGKLRTLYGFEPLITDRIRRYAQTNFSAGGLPATTTATISMGWLGKPSGDRNRAAFATATQRGLTTDLDRTQLQKLNIVSTVYGAAALAQDCVFKIRTSGA